VTREASRSDNVLTDERSSPLLTPGHWCTGGTVRMVLCDPAFRVLAAGHYLRIRPPSSDCGLCLSKRNNIRLSVIWVEFEVPSPIR
jgi:hypothetical protein